MQELLKITGYVDDEYQTQFGGEPYSVMMNPETLKWNRSIAYNNEQPANSSSASQKYKSTPSDTLDFDIVIDCTGVVDSKRTDMADEMKRLEDIIYTYNGDIHRPNYLKVQWGKNFIFKCVLKSIDTTYTLFKPDGSPLRAKVSLSFEQYLSPETVEKKDAPNSPDLSHIVEVVEGDTLPQLSMRIWNNQNYYIQVAKFNGLNKFRNLKGGSQLIFPPIIQPT